MAEILYAGVIGDPVSHSKSPLLKNYWLRENRVNGIYVPIDGRGRPLEEILRDPFLAQFRGFNVTIPYKEQAFCLADQLSDRARDCGSVNTLTREPDGSLTGDSTDGYGFLESLAAAAPGWDAGGKVASILGAGGAARSVIAALIAQGASQIRLSNRTRARAEQLRESFSAPITIADWQPGFRFYEDADLVVNTTSLGMENQPPFDLELPNLPATCLATDLIYAPLETPFLKRAKQKGAQTVDGLGMLLHQARPGFERWFDAVPKVTEALRACVLGSSGFIP
ncbi:MAG: shikimate dehydrogenase [Neomegalonema sp.]|nr:shikimate dehydrogenase [Neomegalonema sp.]